jgi:hypothetical protein
MRRFLILGLCVAVIGLASYGAQANALSMLFPYTVNVLEDNDWESIIMGDGDDDLEVGEVLVGMLYVQEVWDALGPGSNTATTETFTAVFALQVLDLDTSGQFPIYTFGAIAKDDWDTLVDDTNQNLGLTDPMHEGTVGQVFSDTSNPFIDESASDSMADSIMTAIEGQLLWEIGFREGDATEFWTALTNSTTISTLFILQTRISINVLEYYDLSKTLLKHDYLWDGATDAINPLGLHVFSEIQGYGGLSSVDNGNFDLSTDTDFYIVPTPEPASLALFGLGLAAACGLVVRRRRRS